MKHRILWTSLVMLMTIPLFAQQQGAKGQVFNYPKNFYHKLNPTSSTANDTTTWINIDGAQGLPIVIEGSATDSCAAIVWYRVKQGNLPYAITGTWTLIDTLGPAGDGTQLMSTGASQLLGTIAASVTQGYNQIQFYVDYISGMAADGTVTVDLYYYFTKPSSIQAK